MLIKRALDSPVTAWRDNRFNAFVGKVFKDGVGVVSLICTERGWLQIRQQRKRLRAVAGFTTREAESSEHAQSLDQGVNLRAQSAARPPERLVTVFLGAPAAC